MPTRPALLAALGAPHLHFHVMGGPDPVRANGLPFVIDTVTLAGRLTSPDVVDHIFDTGVAPLQPGFAAREETAISPLAGDLMNCPAP
ncbi:hypothetical protein LV457_06790 [Mycobacterium sp. MYCO198283]|uniref:hypothetical protein n=1 Tax=Mycobacterium sp. MYCO198283 TaxID=2883505 RepID=UPI001E29FCB3|nr:hypothetical protein [Mycobacterium sp. MYCO198283]MCG5431997.1 hypothetical protein [Mycobacterium sp. MYCO198283]